MNDEKTVEKGSNSLLSGFFHIGLGTAINMIIGFFTTPIITRIVDPEEFGRFSIFNMCISICIMVLCFGLDQALVRFYYKDKTIAYKRWLVWNCCVIPIKFATVFVVVASMIIIGFKIHFDFSDSLILLSIGIIAHLTYRYGTLILRLENKNKLYSAVYVANKVIYIVLAFSLVLYTKFNSFSCLAFATVAAFLSTALFSVVMSRDKWRFVNQKNCKIVSRKDLLMYGMPFIVSMGLTTLFQSLDKISLKRFCDYSTVGIYTSGVTIIGVFAIIQTTFNTMWSPMMVKHYEKNPEDKYFYTKYNSIISVIMFAFGFSLVLCKDIFGLLLGSKYRAAASLVPFLAIEPIMLTVSETTVTGIVVKNKSHMNIVVAAISCLVNFCGNTILVPQLGPKGAAISTGVSYIVFFALRTAIGCYFYKVDYNLKKYALITLALIFFAMINTFAGFGIWTIVSYILCMILLIILYMNTVKSLWSICWKGVMSLHTRKHASSRRG